MRTFIALLLTLVPLSIRADTSLPQDFTVNEDFAILQMTMTVDNSSNVALGDITKDVLSLTTNFTYTVNKQPVARAEETFLSWGHQSKVYDGSGAYIGMIKEEIFSSFFRAFNQYTVTDAQGNIVGTSQKQSLFATNIDITAPDGTKLATIDRPYFHLYDTWTVHILSPKLDPRLILFIAAYKTDADNHKKKH